MMMEQDFQLVQVSIKQAALLAQKLYGIEGEIKTLTGEVDFNFLIKGENGDQFTLKISRPGTDQQALEFQAAMTGYLAQQDLPFAIPQLINNLEGNWLSSWVDELGQNRLVRLQSWIPGRLIQSANPLNEQLLRKWGRTAGHMSKGLQGFDHQGAHRHFVWDPSNVLDQKHAAQYLKDPIQLSIANYFWDLFEQETLPQLEKLRKSINHNDAHELNVLISNDALNPEITGVIDFGDAVYTHTVNELAIACAYAGMGQKDPLNAIREVVAGYNSVFPLQEEEVSVLFSLINARLLISVCKSAENQLKEPENAYLQVSDQAAWDLLTKLREVPPALAHYSFRSACNWMPCPHFDAFQNWAEANQAQFSPVVGIDKKEIIHLDLDVGGAVLGNNSQFESCPAMHKTIFRYMEDQQANLGVGGYLETRPFYTTDAYQVLGNNGPQWRTVHIGLDFWEPAGSPVFAPLAGKVHSFQDNAADCDYGPTIILEHQVSDELSFYTLYGHLSRSSLVGLSIGQSFEAGAQIASIGPAPENGNWPPHLHFQLMLDMLGKEGDFPGVAYPHELEIWKSICPDPALVAPAFKDVIRKQVASEQATLLNKRAQLLGKGLSISYQKPLHMVRGQGQYLYDTTARRYLDTVNNVAHVGHEHPKVVAAGQYQMGLLNTNTRYLHKNLLQYAEKLLDTFPPELSVVHFVNSGSEANELAMRMVQTYTGSRDMLAIEVGYHGNTGRAVDVSSYKFDGKGGKGAPVDTHILSIPDTYRGKHKESAAYKHELEVMLEGIRAHGKKIGGFIGESILSCGGQIVPPENYFKDLYASVRAAGGICIADEVQVGFGRVGAHFWGFELQGVVPDIVTLGKPIGNGHPMGAVVTTPEVAEAFANGMEFFSTFGGNPVSCAIGNAVLEVIEEEELQAQADKLGNYLKVGLSRLMDQHPIIGDVRGHGFFLGFELVRSRATKEPAPRVASYIANRMRTLGVLMSTDGPYYNVIKIKPPMCFSQQNADFLLESLDQVLGEDFIQSQLL